MIYFCGFDFGYFKWESQESTPTKHYKSMTNDALWSWKKH